MGNAIARRHNNSCSLPELTQNISFVTESDVKHEFSALVLPFTRKQLSATLGVTTQAVAHWHNEDRAPNTASTFNAGQAIPSVRRWIVERSGYQPSDLSLDEIIAGLHAVAAQNTADGRIARQLLVANYAARTQSDNVIPPIVGMAWDLIDQKMRGGK